MILASGARSHFESAKKRQDAGKMDILNDGVIRGDETVRSESASESRDIEDPRWSLSDEEDMSSIICE